MTFFSSIDLESCHICGPKANAKEAGAAARNPRSLLLNLQTARQRLGVRQSSGAFGWLASIAIAPEDWRTPKSGGASDGSWRASTTLMARIGTMNRGRPNVGQASRLPRVRAARADDTGLHLAAPPGQAGRL